MAEEQRRLTEATEAIQTALVSQDANAIRAAIARYGHVLQTGTDQSQVRTPPHTSPHRALPHPPLQSYSLSYSLTPADETWQADLNVAKNYLQQLEDAATAAAQE